METILRDTTPKTWWKFLPYLWGMETPKQTVQVRRLFWRFLPYLWGMETRKHLASEHACLSSYRTYEEWKRHRPISHVWPRHRSYRTYEEWKLRLFKRLAKWGFRFLPYLWGMETPLSIVYISNTNKSSYRTYEEWKLHYQWEDYKHLITFLPYLWGMETSPCLIQKVKCNFVLTVPMRNGNFV